MLEWLRSLKATYVINNLINYSKIAHNRALFKKYGLRRPLPWPIQSEVFSDLPQAQPWIDQAQTKEELQNHPNFQQLSAEEQKMALQWYRDGYLIFPRLFSAHEVDEINREIDQLLASGRISERHYNKIYFAYRQSDLLQEVVKKKEILQIMGKLLGRPLHPFQSLNFIKGSQQRAHSDSIHMTTFPKGYLSATWLALEGVDEDNGPLFYYPGSHRLPYVMNPDFDHGGDRFRIGRQANKRYEEKIADIIEEEGLERKTFHAQPGDLLIWHANLIHGGDPIADPDRTRKSMVVHYFAKDVICYHELTQRLALLPAEQYH